MPIHFKNPDMMPSDPFILLSYINTKLRDEYPSLEALCEGLDLSKEEITARLAAIGYSYERESNRFAPILP